MHPRKAQVPVRRPTIGLLVSAIEGTYHTPIWHGVSSVVQAAQANLVCFVGGFLHVATSTSFEDPGNVVYGLASPDNVDGLIIISSSLVASVDQAELARFYARYSRLPAVSVGVEMEGIPSVVVDNTSGLHDAIAHLICDHGHRRIAFIRGPEGHLEAEERYRTYRETLSEYGISFDPELVAPGDFATSEVAIPLLFDERQVSVDAIVSANDNMALDALFRLEERGINVPHQVALVSFDDAPLAKSSSVALTTVRQPIYQLGQKGAELILAMLDAKLVPERVVLPTELIVRRSCGCIADEVVVAAADDAALADTPLLSATWRERTLTEIQRAAWEYHAELSPKWAKCLLDSVLAELFDRSLDESTRSTGDFLSVLDEVMQQVETSANDMALWHQVLFVLQRRIPLSLMGDDPTLVRAKNLWSRARVRINGTILNKLAYQEIRETRFNETVRNASQALLSAFDVTELCDTIAEQLPLLGITGCYLVLYERPHASRKVAAWSRLLLAYNANGRVSQDKVCRFRSRKLLPDGLLPQDRPQSLIVHVLYFGEEQLGFVLFEAGDHASALYRVLRGQISSALKGALLMQQVQQHARELEASVAERTADLVAVNQRLEQEIAERTQAEGEIRKLNAELEERVRERTAELESFVYSVSHDLRAPLRAMAGFSQILLDKRSASILPDDQRYLQMICDNAHHMSQLIDALLGLAHIGQRTLVRQIIDPSQVVRQVLEELGLDRPGGPIQVLVHKLAPCYADPNLLGVVYTNLLSNAVKFTREQESPVVELGCQRIDQENVYYVRDNGIGFDMSYADKLFGVFERLHSSTKYGGTGIGLAIVQRAIHRHGGRVWGEAKENEGATFYFTLSDRVV